MDPRQRFCFSAVNVSQFAHLTIFCELKYIRRRVQVGHPETYGIGTIAHAEFRSEVRTNENKLAEHGVIARDPRRDGESEKERCSQ